VYQPKNRPKYNQDDIELTVYYKQALQWTELGDNEADSDG